MVVALNCFQAVNAIGYPEARIVLARRRPTLRPPKSNAAYAAINKAQELVRATGNLPVLHRACADKFDERHWLWQRVRIPHDSRYSSAQEYLPEALSAKTL
jgi:putative ATPase